MFKKLLLNTLLLSTAGNIVCQEKQEKTWDWKRTALVGTVTASVTALTTYLFFVAQSKSYSHDNAQFVIKCSNMIENTIKTLPSEERAQKLYEIFEMLKKSLEEAPKQDHSLPYFIASFSLFNGSFSSLFDFYFQKTELDEYQTL